MFRISAVMSSVRRNQDWQDEAAAIVRRNTPAHIALDCVFLDHGQMRRFRRLHADWVWALRCGTPHQRSVTSRSLVRFLRTHDAPPPEFEVPPELPPDPTVGPPFGTPPVTAPGLFPEPAPEPSGMPSRGTTAGSASPTEASSAPTPSAEAPRTMSPTAPDAHRLSDTPLADAKALPPRRGRLASWLDRTRRKPPPGVGI
jgi:hypothetical protein